MHAFHFHFCMTGEFYDARGKAAFNLGFRFYPAVPELKGLMAKVQDDL